MNIRLSVWEEGRNAEEEEEKEEGGGGGTLAGSFYFLLWATARFSSKASNDIRCNSLVVDTSGKSGQLNRGTWVIKAPRGSSQEVKADEWRG